MKNKQQHTKTNKHNTYKNKQEKKGRAPVPPLKIQISVYAQMEIVVKHNISLYIHIFFHAFFGVKHLGSIALFLDSNGYRKVEET